MYALGAGDSATKPPPTTAASRHAPMGDVRAHYGQWNLGIAYGATPTQVRREIGSPTQTRGNCWLYRGHVRGQVGTIRGRFAGLYIDAMKFCFSAGPTGGTAMMRILSHSVARTIVRRDAAGNVISRRSYPAGWGGPITLMKVPDWYRQQNS